MYKQPLEQLVPLKMNHELVLTCTFLDLDKDIDSGNEMMWCCCNDNDTNDVDAASDDDDDDLHHDKTRLRHANENIV